MGLSRMNNQSSTGEIEEKIFVRFKRLSLILSLRGHLASER